MRESFLFAALLTVVGGCSESNRAPSEPGPRTQVEGFVSISPDSKPLAGAAIALVDGSDYTVAAGPVVTNSLGKYAISNAPEGEFYVFVFHGDFLMLDREVTTVNVVKDFTVQHDLRMIRSELWSTRGFRIVGQVRDADTGAPIQGAFVSTFWGQIFRNFVGISLSQDAITNAQGSFELNGISRIRGPSGEDIGLFPYAVAKEGYRPFASAIIPIPDPPDTTVEVVVELSRGTGDGSIAGRLVHQGKPVGGIPVGLDFFQRKIFPTGDRKGSRPDVPVLGVVSITDSLGTYEFRNLSPGWYFVEAAFLPDDGYVQHFGPSTALGEGESIEMEDISLLQGISPISPAPRAVVSDATPIFQWEPAVNAEHYELQFGDGHLMEVSYDSLMTPQFVLPDSMALPDGTVARWIVTAYKGHEEIATFEEIPTFFVSRPVAAQE